MSPFLMLALTSPVLAAADGETPFVEMVVEMLPVGEVLGSGLEDHRLQLLVLNPDGSPVSELKAKVKATGGTADKLVQPVAPGLFGFHWIPPVVDMETDFELRIKGVAVDGAGTKHKFDKTWSIPVTPPLGQRVQVSVEPAAPMLGTDPDATVAIELTGGAAETLEGAQLMVLSSAGTVAPPTGQGGGSYTAAFTLPEAEAPLHALLTFADRREPTRTYGHLAVPMGATTTLALEPGKGCTVKVDVKGELTEPVEADRRGRAKVEVALPAGLSTVTSVVEGCDTAGDFPVELPPSTARRVQLMPLHAGLPADPGVKIPVRAVAIRPDGQPDGDADLRFEATHGSFALQRHEGNGVFVAEYTPSAEPLGAEATLSAVLYAAPEDGGEPVADEAQRSSLPLKLVPLRPAELSVSSQPAALAKDDRQLTLTFTVADGQGQGLAGRRIGLTLAGAKPSGELVDNGDGTYTAALARTGRGPVDVVATVKAPAAGNPVRDIVLLPTRTRLPPDGLSGSRLTILTLDEFGYPVADTPLSLSLVSGDGQLPTKAKTDDNGVAQVTYTAGRTPGPVHVKVVAGGHTRGFGLVQLPQDAPGELSLDPAEGPPTESQRRKAAAWAPIVTTLTVPRQ